MSNSFSKKRPSFDQFRQLFMDIIAEHSQVDLRDGILPWPEVGDEKKRRNILTAFEQRLEKELGVPVYIERGLGDLDKPTESVVIQLFHVFSTVYLVEHINQKAYGRRSLQPDNSEQKIK